MLDALDDGPRQAQPSGRGLIADPAVFFHDVGRDDAPAIFQDDGIGPRLGAEQADARGKEKKKTNDS